MDLNEYWKNRGKDYYEKYQLDPKYLQERHQKQEKKLLEILSNEKFERILEIGCGFGRFTKILSSVFNPEKYVALDLSQDQIQNAKKYINNSKIEFHCTKIQDFNSGEKFDLVFAGEVLLHISEEDVDDVISKIVKFSRKKIVTIDWYDEKRFGEEIKEYLFMHDYKELYEKHGAKKVKTHFLEIPLSLKMISTYAKLRGRHGIDKQAIFEVEV